MIERVPPDLVTCINEMLSLSDANERRKYWGQMFRKRFCTLLWGVPNAMYEAVQQVVLEELEAAYELAHGVRMAEALASHLKEVPE